VIAAPGKPVPPLTSEELATLERWPWRLRRMLVVSLGLVAVWVAGFAVGEPWWQVPMASIAGAVLVGTGIAAQLLVRCPRCERPAPLQAGLALPLRCPRCRVSFRTHVTGEVD
jgi:phage FluMu protein Com